MRIKVILHEESPDLKEFWISHKYQQKIFAAGRKSQVSGNRGVELWPKKCH